MYPVKDSSIAFYRDENNQVYASKPNGDLDALITSDLLFQFSVTKTGIVDSIVSADGYRQQLHGLPYSFNAQPSKLLKWRAALANMRAGISNANLVCVGDSTTAGRIATTDIRATSYPVRLAETLAKSFGNVDANNVFTVNQTATAFSTFDPRVTFGATWTNGGNSTIFGQMFVSANGTAPSDLSFSVSKNVDRVRVYYRSQLNYATIDVKVNGTTVGTIVANDGSAGTISNQTFSFTKTTGPSTVVITKSTGQTGNAQVAKVVAYDSANTEVTVHNAGLPGTTSVTFNNRATPIGRFTNISSFDNHLYLFMLTINDSNNFGLNGLDNYKANMTQMIQDMSVTGSVVLITGFPSDTVRARDGTLDAYIRANYELAVALDIPLFDLTRRYVSFDYTNPIIPYSDTLHFTAQGYADAAQAIANFVQNIS